MAIEFIDSFNHYASEDILKKWTSIGGGYLGSTFSIVANAGRRGDRAFRLYTNANYAILNKTVGRSREKRVCMAIKFTQFPQANSQQYMLHFLDFGIINVTVEIRPDGGFNLIGWTGSGGTTRTILAQSELVISLNSYYWLDVETKIGVTDGTFKLRVNGTEYINVTGIATRRSTETEDYVNSIGIGVPGYVGSTFIDFYIAEIFIADQLSNGGSLDGDKRIDVLLPNDNGNYSQFVNSSGNFQNNYTYVDDEVQDDLASYVQSSVSGEKDSYLLSNISHDPSVINAIQVLTTAKKSDTGIRSISHFLRINNTDYEGDVHPLITSMFCNYDIYETNPNTSFPWTKTEINALEAGQKVAE